MAPPAVPLGAQSVDDLKAIVEAFTNLGLAVGLVVIGVFFAWRSGRFLAPKLTTFFEAHVGLIDSLKETQASQTLILQAQGEELRDQGDALDNQRVILEDIQTKVSQCAVLKSVLPSSPAPPRCPDISKPNN